MDSITSEKLGVDKIYDFKYKIQSFCNETIFVIENFLDLSFCDEMVELIQKVPKNIKKYSDTNNVECYVNDFNEMLYDDDTFYYSFSTDNAKYDMLIDNTKNNKISYVSKTNCLTRDDIKKYITYFDNKTNILKKMFVDINPRISFEFNSGMILREIFGKTRLHIDNIQNDKQFNKIYMQQNKESKKINYDTIIIRNATSIYSFNDNYEGGMLKFPNFNFEIKLKKGSIIIFPPYWTHTHETDELINNTIRYTMTTWYGQSI